MSICLIVIVCIMKLYLKFKLYSYIIFSNGKLRKIINNDLPNIVRIRKNTTTNGQWMYNTIVATGQTLTIHRTSVIFCLEPKIFTS